MLCKKIKLDDLVKLTGPEIIAEPKYDGVRLFCKYNAKRLVAIYTRNGIDLLPRIYKSATLKDEIPHKVLYDNITMLDGEMMLCSKESNMPLSVETIAGVLNQLVPSVPKNLVPKFICFDVVTNEDLSLAQRKLFLSKLEGLTVPHSYYLHDNGLPWRYIKVNSWLEAYQHAVKEGHEGLVLKDLSQMYRQFRRDWYKIKKVEEYLGVIVGSKLTEMWTAQGLIGSLIIYIPTSRKQIHVSNMTAEQRVAFTTLDSKGLPTLCEDFKGAEVIVQGQQDTKDSVRHAHIKEIYRKGEF